MDKQRACKESFKGKIKPNQQTSLQGKRYGWEGFC